MCVKPYIARARSEVQVAAKATVYQDGAVCGLKFHSIPPEGQQAVLLHDTGLRFRGRDPYVMALRGAHFIQQGERLSGGREHL